MKKSTQSDRIVTNHCTKAKEEEELYVIYSIATGRTVFGWDSTIQECKNYIDKLIGEKSNDGENEWQRTENGAKLVYLKTGQVLQTLGIRKIEN